MGCGPIGSNNGLPTFATVIHARYMVILAYHEGGCLVEVFTVWGRVFSLFPLRLQDSGFGVRHIRSFAASHDGESAPSVALGQRARY